MPPPKKRAARLRVIARQRWSGGIDSHAPADRTNNDLDADLVSDSEDEVYLIESDEDIGEGEVELAVCASLKWVEGAAPKRPAVYRKDSRTTHWRQKKIKAKMTASVSDCRSITSYFQKANSALEPSNDHPAGIPCKDTDNVTDDYKITIDEAIAKLEQLVSVTSNRIQEKRLAKMTKYDFVRHSSLLRYFMLLKSGERTQKASLEAAVLFPNQSKQYTARKIRKWAESFACSQELPQHSQGKHIKTKSLIFDEDVASKCKIFLKSQINDAITGLTFAHWIGNHLHIEADLPRPVTISTKTAVRWLHVLGMDYVKYSKGLYFDGHERPDVVSYREEFLQRMSQHERFFFKYEGEDMRTVVSPDLNDGERPRVLVTHDESCFSSHDGKTTIWMDANDRPLRPKGQGRSIMVSEFLCECHGPMKLNHEQREKFPDVPFETKVIITPGKQQDGYWTAANLVEQVRERAMPIFKILHPDSDALFLFDNSQNHRCLPPNALRASALNLSDGGKNVQKQRAGWFISPDGVRVEQSMQTPEGIQKGVRTILAERGIWNPTFKLTTARELLSKQPDFNAQRSWIEETLMAQPGFFLDFYPKFHCEFNFIELYWGASKAYLRRHCDYTFAGLQRLLPIALSSVSVESIRRFARKCFRFMDAYRVTDENGTTKLTPAQVDFAVKKFKSHRSIPMSIFKDL